MERHIGLFITTLFILFFAWELLYFSVGEGFILGLSVYFSAIYLKKWYLTASKVTIFFNQPLLRLYLYAMPLIPMLLFWVTLNTTASWDVVGAFWYILMYLFLGITWLFVSLNGMLAFWSFSYNDDVLLSRNKATLIVLSASFLAISLIYSGANIGDGPGWWTVVFAGGLGTLSWLILAGVIASITGMIEATIREYDARAALRFAGYLIGSGFIFAKASSGDWTSFNMTVIEFMSCWPVIPLAVLLVILEKRLFKFAAVEGESWLTTIITGMAYLIYGLFVIFI